MMIILFIDKIVSKGKKYDQKPKDKLIIKMFMKKITI